MFICRCDDCKTFWRIIYKDFLNVVRLRIILWRKSFVCWSMPAKIQEKNTQKTLRCQLVLMNRKTIVLFTRHKLTRVRPALKLTRVSFCRVNTASPGSTRVKSNPPPEVGSTRVNTNLGRTRVSFDFTHAYSCVLWSCLTRTSTRIYKTIDLIQNIITSPVNETSWPA